MTTHIVLWNFAPTLSEAEKKAAKLQLKEVLLPLQDQIPGVISIKLIFDGLPSGNREIALLGEYESVAALNAYLVHPLHVEAGKYVRSVTCDRACMDF